MTRVRRFITIGALLAIPLGGHAQDVEPPRVAPPKQVTTVKATRSVVKTVRVDVPIQKANHDTSAPAFRGEGWFQQECGVCHLGRWRKHGQLQPFAPPLTGVLKNANPARETAVRAFIQAGSQNMPGFRNTFTA